MNSSLIISRMASAKVHLREAKQSMKPPWDLTDVQDALDSINRAFGDLLDAIEEVEEGEKEQRQIEWARNHR